MPRFIVDLWLDGISDDEDSEEMVEACLEFLEEQLDFSASSVHCAHVPDEFGKEYLP